MGRGGKVCPHCGAGACPAWAVTCCFPRSIPTRGEDHVQEGKGLVGGGQPGRAGLWHSKVVPGAVMFIRGFLFIFPDHLLINMQARA